MRSRSKRCLSVEISYDVCAVSGIRIVVSVKEAIPNSKVKIEDYVALSDIVLLPYKTLEGTEANPSCVLESMAVKTVVVTSKLPELTAIAKDNKKLTGRFTFIFTDFAH